MGAIFRGRNRSTGEVVAVKVMAAHIATNPVLLQRFEQEFRAASRLNAVSNGIPRFCSSKTRRNSPASGCSNSRCSISSEREKA